MNTSPSITKIATALLLAQKEIGSAKKGATNPFYKMKYSDLGSVMEACKEAFNNHGISVIQPIITNEVGTFVMTTLLHESGEYISSSMKVSCKSPENPQEMGSAITYAKRYSLQALAFIPSEDDDGELATKPSRPATEPIKTTSTPVVKNLLLCSTCKKSVDDKVVSFSKSKFGKVLCFNCQPRQTTANPANKVEEKIEINTDDLPF